MAPRWARAPYTPISLCAVLASCPGLHGTEVQARDPRAAVWYCGPGHAVVDLMFFVAKRWGLADPYRVRVFTASGSRVDGDQQLRNVLRMSQPQPLVVRWDG